MKSDSVNWVMDFEEFDFDGDIFDVRKAKELIKSKPRKIDELEIKFIKSLVGERGETNSNKVFVNWDKALSEKVDLSIPVIVAHYHQNYLPIDGWHRIAKAKVNDIKLIPCVLLNKKETAAIMGISYSTWLSKEKSSK